MRARILIAEDEFAIREALIFALKSEDFSVVTATDSEQAVLLFPLGDFDLVILDAVMPWLSGYDVCRLIRERDARVPVLFLTAEGEEVDKVPGLKIGADDYMTKPFDLRELQARVNTLLRRARAADADGTDAANALPEVFAFGAAVIDRKQFTATLDGAEAALTVRELKLLEVLASHPNEVLTWDVLLNAVWGVAYSGTTRTLDQYIARLRKKVERRPDEPEVILTAHGIGYRYESATK
jgi:DNA-binding response OmpR family regulator